MESHKTGPEDDADDDSDFNDSDNDVSSGKDNLEFEKNVTKGIELGCDGGASEREEGDYAVMVHDEDHEADDLECPSSEVLLSAITSRTNTSRRRAPRADRGRRSQTS